jgi:hypothetical protein
MATMSMMFVSGLVPAKISASSTSASSSVLSSSSCTSSSSVGCIRTWVHVRSSCSSSSSHQLHHGSLLVPTKRRLFRDSSSSSSFISSSNVCCTTRLGSLVGDKLVIRKRRRIIAPAPPHSRPAGRIRAEQKTDLLRGSLSLACISCFLNFSNPCFSPEIPLKIPLFYNSGMTQVEL